MMTRIPHSFQTKNALKLSSFVSVPSRPSMSTTASPSLFLSSRHDYSTTTSEVVDLKYSKFAPPPQQQPQQQKQEQYPPVLFLHGLLGNKRNFASLASSLSLQLQKPRTIYTLDLRNHGDNNHDWRINMSYSDMARDVLAFIDDGAIATQTENNEQQVVVVGHSMGGKVAQALALMYPERIAGLVVLDIAPVRYHASGKEGWRTIEEIVNSVSSINLDSTVDAAATAAAGGGEMAQLQYKQSVMWIWHYRNQLLYYKTRHYVHSY